MTAQHRIPDPPPITPAMLSDDGAWASDLHPLVGRTIVTLYEIPDSEREESLLLLDDGRVLMMSCDHGYRDDEMMSRDPLNWEFIAYELTGTPAAEALIKLEPGHWI